jgi:hypothetical protein
MPAQSLKHGIGWHNTTICMPMTQQKALRMLPRLRQRSHRCRPRADQIEHRFMSSVGYPDRRKFGGAMRLRQHQSVTAIGFAPVICLHRN